MGTSIGTGIELEPGGSVNVYANMWVLSCRIEYISFSGLWVEVFESQWTGQSSNQSNQSKRMY